MGMQTDVRAISLAESGAVTDARTRVRSMVIEPGTSAGSVVIKNGGSGGITLFTINTTANGETFNVLIPEQGVLCTDSAYAELTNAKATVFYG